ncbi:family 16 glycosylhydrolase [Pseudoruegeria sp. SHC-113]|uniref:family 16 glycosylhydrolase n=1 Tax=Pseudoruegeria sp. SHC-113 TaxID=2855439 RepID=UPI0021BB2BE3|nr:family 16 glycosylhydrolase [Pseudoruegeria sp. SHC-113]MCT8159332.1 family 16 glycosylhydrolase [Pseudoruegeria sp. SHC-113]
MNRLHTGLAALALAGSLAPMPASPLPSASAPGAGFMDRFPALDSTAWSVAHYDFSHPAFDTDWRRGNLRAAATGLSLSLRPHSGGANRFSGASLRRHAPTGYGRYEVVMRTARGAGLVTGFFTYTGPAYGSRHDEIDIEILGKSPDHLHAAWFVDGKLQSRRIPLGFDASEGFNHYAFDWHPGFIAWQVNGREVLRINARDGHALPEVPGRLFANIWAADPSIADWAGHAAPDTEARAVIRCIAFSPASPDGRAPRPSCSGPSPTS